MDNSHYPLMAPINYLVAKRAMFLEEKQNLSTIVLGSSHGDFGFNPQFFPHSFNLCSRSQDFKHSHLLYQYTIEKTPHLKNVVIFYSLFSSGNILENSPSEKFLAPILNEIFSLGVHYDDPLLSRLTDSFVGRLGKLPNLLEGNAGFLPKHEKGFMPKDYGVERRVSEHMSLNAKEDGNAYLANMLILANQQNHNVVLVIPPVHPEYKNQSGGDTQYLFRGLFELIDMMGLFFPNLKIKVVNGFDDDEFLPEHFGDYDHLIPDGEGVALLSKKIAHTVQSF